MVQPFRAPYGRTQSPRGSGSIGRPRVNYFTAIIILQRTLRQYIICMYRLGVLCALSSAPSTVFATKIRGRGICDTDVYAVDDKCAVLCLLYYIISVYLYKMT